jgi:hypothetical protein
MWKPHTEGASARASSANAQRARSQEGDMVCTSRLRTRGFVPSLLLAFSLLLVPVAPGLAATLYVDSVGGSDGASGLTPGTAWRTLAKVNATTFAPGDSILFKAGYAWSGQLWPKGSGAEGAPITVASYGVGAKPLINGNGAAQEALLLYNQQYWEIGHLEITNYDPAGPDVDPYRQGIRVLGEDAGTLHHIYLRDLDVHDVNGSITVGRDQGKCNAGILFDVEGATTPTSFDEVLIEGCSVHDCERSGIKLWTNWGRSCDQADPALHTNVIIRSNVVDSIAGDGINVHQTAGALAEYNLVSRSCYWTANANAALWTWASDDAVIQYNEVYQSMQTRDGMAFDIDGCSQRCIFQYNYSHDNQGGFVMVIGVPDCVGGGPYSKFCNDNHFRYNISQNDGTRIYRLVGKVWDNYIYNNVAYLDDTNPDWVEGLSCGSPAQWADRTYFWNNVFYNTNSDSAYFSLGASANTVFDYNVFYGNHPASEAADPHKLTSDPKLVAPGIAGLGRNTVGGYRLRPDSPCISSGMAIPDSGGQDYWGNAVPAGAGPDRGAYEYPFDAFGTHTIGLYAPSLSEFSLRNSNSAGGADLTFRFGPSPCSWTPFAADWDGDGDDTVGFYDPAGSVFRLRNSNSAGVSDLKFKFGPSPNTWKPIAGDWDGNGTETVGLYDPAAGTFRLINANATASVADLKFRFGPAPCIWLPIAGDWNGDGIDTVGLYEPATGTFRLINTNAIAATAHLKFIFGPAPSGWQPIVGDWDGR